MITHLGTLHLFKNNLHNHLEMQQEYCDAQTNIAKEMLYDRGMGLDCFNNRV